MPSLSISAPCSPWCTQGSVWHLSSACDGRYMGGQPQPLHVRSLNTSQWHIPLVSTLRLSPMVPRQATVPHRPQDSTARRSHLPRMHPTHPHIAHHLLPHMVLHLANTVEHLPQVDSTVLLLVSMVAQGMVRLHPSMVPRRQVASTNRNNTPAKHQHPPILHMVAALHSQPMALRPLPSRPLLVRTLAQVPVHRSGIIDRPARKPC